MLRINESRGLGFEIYGPGQPEFKNQTLKAKQFYLPNCLQLDQLPIEESTGFGIGGSRGDMIFMYQGHEWLRVLIDCKDQREQIEGSSGKLKGLKGSMAEQNRTLFGSKSYDDILHQP